MKFSNKEGLLVYDFVVGWSKNKSTMFLTKFDPQSLLSCNLNNEYWRLGE